MWFKTNEQKSREVQHSCSNFFDVPTATVAPVSAPPPKPLACFEGAKGMRVDPLGFKGLGLRI